MNAALHKTPFELRPGPELRGEWRLSEMLARHTSWGVGGPAECFYTPPDREDLKVLLSRLPADLPRYWLGLGSNLLVRDGGLPGLVIHTRRLREIEVIGEDRLRVEAGAGCARLVQLAARNGLRGIEFLSGVPGSVGGALVMNAGAHGGQIWDWVRHVEYLDPSGNEHILPAEQVRHGYRRAELPDGIGLLAAELQLNASGDPAGARAAVRELLKQRGERQPIGSANAGSVFKNPPDDAAARLLEAAGLAGERRGGAEFSSLHANFIINTGEASAADIEALIEFGRDRVRSRFGCELEPEVKIVGRPAGGGHAD